MKPGVDYIGVSAGAVITDGAGKYFLAKRGNGARDDIGKWEFPGGTINFYETREEAVRRNILEKHNLSITVERLLGVYDVIDTRDKDHWLSATYMCSPKAGGVPEVVNHEKCSGIGWFTLNELRRLDLSRITMLNVRDLLYTQTLLDC